MGIERRVAGLLVLALAALSAGGCAVMNLENRRTLNALDAHLAPESDAGRWAAAPVALPAALVGLTADAFIVQPSTVFDDAWYDTVDWLWTPAPDESRFRRAVLLPVVMVATPLVYVADWFRRAFFAVPPREEEE